MTFAHARIIVITLAAGAAGCAQQAVRPAASAPAPSSAAMATVPSAHAKTYGISPHLLQMARDDGYRPEVRDGKTFFCRHVTPIGSDIPVTHCVDATNLRWEVEYEQRERQRLREGEPMVGQPGTGS